MGRKSVDVVRVRALFADLDGAPLANAWNVPLAPGWITRTSPGRFHAYWKVEGINLHEFRDLQKRIIALTGADTKICDLPRVLRIPGFPHQKGEPYLVEGQAIEGEATVNSRDAVMGILPATKAPTPVERHPARLRNGGDAARKYAVAALESEACYV